MTGAEFREALKDAGYSQAAFALAMGVHRQTIGKQCEAAHVERVWAYALAGLIAATATEAVQSIITKIDDHQ
jgi:DNA-binding XRE family transcriptional regulator